MRIKHFSAIAIFLIANIFYVLPGFAQNNNKKFVDGKPFRHTPRPPMNHNTPCPQGKFRTVDGTCNNIAPNKLEWGATEIPLFREIAAKYGSSDPKNALNGETRPSARAVSNLVCEEPIETFSQYNLSAFVYIWGQFIDHDLTLTPTGTESAPVILPVDEPLFTVDIPFSRSEPHLGTGVNNARQQTNLNTSWLDASMVYGSETDRANWLRTFSNGKMKVSSDNLLPYNTTNFELTGSIDPDAPSMVSDNNGTTKSYVAGDVRAMEHPALTAMHVLFVREHNRICDKLKLQGLTNDEELYQRARKEVGAIIQAITYYEFLPTFGISIAPFQSYKPNTRPDITNIFATAAYRFGHTVVADDILLRDNDCEEVGPGELDLVDVFFDNTTINTYNIDPVLKGLSAHTQYELDLKINSVLRNLLFGNANQPVVFGLDLASLNIQRGRDHGLPDYNTVRKFYTGNAAANFKKISSADSTATDLQTLYGTVNNVDLWVGLLAEDQLPNKSVGKTLHNILKTQFENLRDGDFYYFENDPFLPQPLKAEVKNTRLGQVITRNTGLTTLQSNVFMAEECPDDAKAVNDRSQSPQNVDAPTFSISPNPAVDILKVSLGNRVGADARLEISSMTGATMTKMGNLKANQTVQISVVDLTPGVYIISLISGKEKSTEKFSKL